MRNQDLRDEIKRARLYGQDVADQLQISKSTLYTWLGQNLTDEKRKMIYQAIDSAAEKRFAARKKF